MKDKFGTVLGFTIGLLLIGLGIIIPNHHSNLYVKDLKQIEDNIQTYKQNKQLILLKREKKRLKDFKESWYAAIIRFLDLKSFLIVFGGSYAAVLIAFPFSKAVRTFRYMGQVFAKDKITKDFLDVYNDILTLAEKRVNNDLISDELVAEIKNENLRQWVGDFIVVDLIEEKMIDEIISSEIEMFNYRAFEEIDVLEFMGRTAPAFGMVGTIVGLILMLSEAGGESGVAEVMGAMSVALITTLYGALVAQLVFIPVAQKKYQIKESGVRLLQMIREGVLYLKKRELPEVAGQDLIIYLPQTTRATITKEKLAAMNSGELGL